MLVTSCFEGDASRFGNGGARLDSNLDASPFTEPPEGLLSVNDREDSGEEARGLGVISAASSKVSWA